MPAHDHDQSTTTAPVEAAQETRPARSPFESVLHLQRTAGNQAVAGVLDGGSSSGAPLDTDTRTFMESRLGADFSDVRVHADGAATESARSIGASAYTAGTDIVVQSDQYSPDTDAGRHLLAHELTHVVQQKAGAVDGTPTGDGIALSDPGDRFEQEAERTADAVVERGPT